MRSDVFAKQILNKMKGLEAIFPDERLLQNFKLQKA